jgi:ferrochelatase
MVDFCMRYGNPSTKSKVREMVKAGCTKILFFPLYPHYAGATSATANDQFFRALMEEKWQPPARTVPSLFRASRLYRGARAIGRTAYAAMERRPDILVCSYHGVPKRYLMEGDPYHCQCQKTTRLLKERLGWDDTRSSPPSSHGSAPRNGSSPTPSKRWRGWRNRARRTSP